MHVSKLITHLTHPARSAGLVRDVVNVRRSTWQRERRISRLLREGSAALARMPAPAAPVGLVPLMHCGFYNDASAYVGLAIELLRRNWQPIWVHGDITVPFAPDSEFAEFNGGLRYHSRHEYSRPGSIPGNLQNDWVVDFPNERAICNGNDYFLLIAGKLRRTFKCFDLDWNDEEVNARAAETLCSADAAHSYCDALFEKAKETETPVRFIGAEHLYIPAGVPLMYSKYLRAAKVPQAELFEFIDFGGAYAHFFSEGEFHTRSQFSVQNVTRHETYSRHEVLLPDFENWLADREVNEEDVAFGKRLLNQKWTGSDEIDPLATDALERIAAFRENGGKAAWLFGHAIVELGNPSDFGAVHPTLKDWIASSVEAVRGTDTLLVIKPHPAEARHKPNRKPNQLFRDLFDFPLPENVIFLEPLWAPLNKVLPLVDIGIAWRGSAGAQLMMEGVPVVVCGMHTAYHQILQPPQPRDLAHYKTMLNDPETARVDQEKQRRAALYFSYMKDRAMHAADFLMPPQPVTVEGFSYLRDTLIWDHEKLDAIIAGEVESISKMCDSICA